MGENASIPPRRRRSGEHRHPRLRQGNRPGQSVGGRLEGRQDSGNADGRQPVVLVEIVAGRVVPEIVAKEA